MSQPRIGIIGYGEVGSTFAQAMAQAGARVRAYDVAFTDGSEKADGLPAADGGVTIAPLAQVVSGSRYILSTVTTEVALDVARAAVPFLSPGQHYVDLNSTSRNVKMRMADVIARSGAQFVEGAILGAVGASGARTRVILTGPGARQAAEVLNAAGLNCVEFGQDIGDAASFKMLRSVFSKGIEALLLEMFAGAHQAGIETELWHEIMRFMADHPFDRLARNWIESHVTAYERRYHEMLQVVETLQELGIEPLMSEATLSFFRRSQQLDLGHAIEESVSQEEVIKQLAERLRVMSEPQPS